MLARWGIGSTGDPGPDADRTGVLLTADSSFPDHNKGQLFEVRQSRVARLVLDLMGDARTITISGDLRRQEAGAQPAATSGEASTSYTEATISNLGLASAVKAIEARCERK